MGLQQRLSDREFKETSVEIRVLQKYIMEKCFPLYKINHLKLLYQRIYFEYDVYGLIQHRNRT
jgi:hypothetical protein